MPFHEKLFLGKSYLRDVGYRIGAVVTEMYTHAEALQKHTEVKTRLYKLEESYTNSLAPGETLLNAYHKECPTKCCTGVLEANFKSDVIGVAHIGWLSKDSLADETNLKGRHAEYGPHWCLPD